MNIFVNLDGLEREQIKCIIGLMSERNASLEAHLLGERDMKLLFKYAKKFFPGTRWEEFEAELFMDSALVDSLGDKLGEALWKYIEPRFGGLRWPELEKFIVDNDVPESMITWYKNAIDWNNPKCDFEIPSKLGIAAKVYRVVRYKCETRIVEYGIEQTIYVKAKDEESAQKLADSFGDDMWEEGKEEQGEETDWQDLQDPDLVRQTWYSGGHIEVIAEEDLDACQVVHAEGDKND